MAAGRGRGMRDRLRARASGRPMARRPGEGIALSPRGRRIAGWLAALGALGVIALGARLVGGTGDGTPVAAGPAGSPAAVGQITFGTSLDARSGLVAITARTSTFSAGDTFAYSAESIQGVSVVYVAVVGVDGTEVQPPSEQRVTPGAPIAFSAPADALLEAFGAGEYRMLISLGPAQAPAAEGSFTLEGPSRSGGSPTTRT